MSDHPYPVGGYQPQIQRAPDILQPAGFTLTRDDEEVVAWLMTFADNEGMIDGPKTAAFRRRFVAHLRPKVASQSVTKFINNNEEV